MTTTFEHPANGHRERVTFLDCFGALGFGPLYYIARGAWGYGAVLLLFVIVGLFMGLAGWLWIAFWWALFALTAMPTLAQSYRRRGWREVGTAGGQASANSWDVPRR